MKRCDFLEIKVMEDRKIQSTFLAVLFFMLVALGVRAEERSGFELPEVTILGKDVSEFQYAGVFTTSRSKDEKDSVRTLERPSPSNEKRQRSSFKNLSTTVGRYGTFTSSADLGGMEQDIDYLVQLKYARTDGYRDHAEEDLIRPSGSIGLQLKEGLRFDGDFAFFHKKMDLPGPVSAPTMLATRENQSIDYQARLEFYTSPEQRLMGSIFGTLSRTDEDPLQASFDDQFLGFSTELTQGIFKTGFEFWSERLENFYSYQKITGFAGISGWEILDGLMLESLLRMDYYEGQPVRVDPKASLVWFATDRLSASLSVQREMKVRSWSSSYLSEYYLEGNLDELQPQRGVAGDVTLSYLVKEGLTTSLSFFGEKTRDFFVWGDSDGNGLFTLENYPDLSILGVKLEFQVEFFKSLTGLSRFTFQNVKSEEEGLENVPYLPELKGEWGLEWKGPYGFGVGTNISYLGRQFTERTGEDQIDEVVLWDMTISYRWHSAKFFAKVLNVLDQRYDILDGYPGPDTQYQFGVNLEF